jgi:predicted  nucleic acid-binding Zn-ribbon protein
MRLQCQRCGRFDNYPFDEAPHDIITGCAKCVMREHLIKYALVAATMLITFIFVWFGWV